MLRLDKSTLYASLPLLFGLILGVGFLNSFYKAIDPNENLGEIALGPENTFTLASNAEKQVHCEGGLIQIKVCIDAYLNYGKDNNLILWLGNSQLHSINQIKTGDETASSTLHRQLASQKKYLLTISHANANLQEHFLLFEYLSQTISVNTLILPIVFDDLRETGVRSSLLDILDNKLILSDLEKTEYGNTILTRQKNKKSIESTSDALNETRQEGVEEYLNAVLESILNIWGDRALLRGNILNNLYKFRNWSLDITPTSIRKVIPGRYFLNMKALNEIIESAKRKEIKVLIYIAPIRNDVKIPYDLDDYDVFKSEVMSLGNDNFIKVVNFEDIIPPNYWGTKKSTSINDDEELDFMHFKSEAHKILSDTIFKEIKVENDL